eukprot:Skav232867  [mRNA]  locus=scaffold2451:243489:249386:+ [translate_table: standard]
MHGQVCSEKEVHRTIGQWNRASLHAHGAASSSPATDCQLCCGRRQVSVETWLQGAFPRVQVHLTMDWLHLFEAIQAKAENGHCFIETWFLAPRRHHVCIRSRRLLVHTDVTQEDFERLCKWIWGNMLLPDQPITIVEVTPTPVTLIDAATHVLILQGDVSTHVAALLQSEAIAGINKLRAFLVPRWHTVHDVFRIAQLDSLCRDRIRPCFIQDPSRPDRIFTTEERPHFRTGALVHGDVLRTQVADPPLPDVPDTDTESSWDERDTDVPVSDELWEVSEDERDSTDDDDALSLCQTEAFTHASHHQSFRIAKEDAASPPQAQLAWHDIPVEYRLDDVIVNPDKNDDPSEERDPQASSSHEHPSAAPNQLSAPHSSGAFWHIVFSEMPYEPVPVLAGPSGPTLSEVSAALDMPIRSMVATHPVAHVPLSHSDNFVLVEFSEDRVQHGADAITLLEVVGRDRAWEEENGGASRVFHSMMVTFVHHVRSTLLQVLRLDTLDGRFPNHVLIFHNGTPWTADMVESRQLRHGDLIQIFLEEDSDLQYSTALIGWLQAQGLSPWPSLMRTSQPVVPSTAPFLIQDPNDDHCPSASESVGEPLMQFRTWFISHARHVACLDSRAMSFNVPPTHWKRAIAQTWGDRFDDRLSFTITWVHPHPEPIGSAASDDLPHLIIEQDHRYNMISILLTKHRHDSHSLQTERAAFSVGDRTPTSWYFQLMQVERACRLTHVCRVLHHGQVIRDSELIRRPTGQAIQLEMYHRETHVEQAEDFSTLMQSPASHRLVAGTGEPVHPSQSASSATAHRSCTGEIASHDLQPSDFEALAQLRAQLRFTDAFEVETLAPPALVNTYYLSELSTRRCAFARPVILQADQSHWKEAILQVWIDHLDRSSPSELFVVTPHPPQNFVATGMVAAFVIISQHRTDAHVPTLLTIEEEDEFIHMAQCLETPVDRHQILTATGLADQCLGPDATIACTVSYSSVDITTQPVTYMPPGAGGNGPPHTEVASTQRHEAPVPISLEALLSHVPSSEVISHRIVRGQLCTSPSAGHKARCHPCSHTWTMSTGQQHALEYPEEDLPITVYVPSCISHNDAQDVILRKEQTSLYTPPLEHMRFLYTCGLPRAVVVEAPLYSTGNVVELAERPWISLCFTTEGIGLDPAFELHAPPDPDWSAYDRIVLCSDGSHVFDEPQAKHTMGWAFVVVGETYPEQQQFLGWAGGQVSDCSADPTCIPSCASHSTRAEQEALSWASLWRLTHPHATSTVFISDSKSGLATADGSASVGKNLGAQILRSSARALRAKLPPQGVWYRHTRGHAGQYWNELADRLATFSRRTAPPLQMVVPPLQGWQSIVPHLWTLYQDHGAALDPALNCICEEAFINVQIASANVLSLYTGHAGGVGKVAYLQEQFALQKLHIVGVQESRSAPGCFVSKEWIRFSAGADHGTLGIELWINTAQPYGRIGEQNLFLTKNHFAIVSTHPRHLLARVTAPGFHSWILVAHAPHGGHPVETRAEWWQEMETLLRQHAAIGQCLVCIDANATAGPSHECFVHDTMDDANHSTHLLQRFLANTHLSIPARCGIDLNLHTEDHELCGVQLTWQHQVSTEVHSPNPTAQCDRSKILQDPDLEKALERIPMEPWHLDVHTHHEAVNASLRAALQQHCPAKRHGPRKAFIKPEVWQNRLELLQARRNLKSLQKQHARATQQALLRAWSIAAERSSPIEVSKPANPRLDRLRLVFDI